MIVPKFWAEARIQHREEGRQVTVRRFGWSNTSVADAQAMADERTKAAFDRVWQGEKLPRREPKVAYNGAEGVPIREEILAEQGKVVLTRNGYGAVCLNVPDVLFADVDFTAGLPVRSGWIAAAVGFAVAIVLAIITRSVGTFFTWLLPAIFAAISVASICRRAAIKLQGGPQKWALRKLARFVQQHPDWRIRVYRTPAGLRLLAMHRVFQPADAAAAEFFRAIHADPLYVTMCIRQQCFRARVSPKPWRIGIARHFRVGVWPVSEAALPSRIAWVQEYDAKAANYASCHFVAEIGSGNVSEDVRPTQLLHDQLSRAETSLPIA